MPALHEDGTTKTAGDQLGGDGGGIEIGDFRAGQNLGLGNVGGDKEGERKESVLERTDRGGLEEARAGGRHHHGIDDDGEPEQFISTLRASPRELLAAALESEIEEENRAHPGSNGDQS